MPSVRPVRWIDRPKSRFELLCIFVCDGSGGMDWRNGGAGGGNGGNGTDRTADRLVSYWNWKRYVNAYVGT